MRLSVGGAALRFATVHLESPVPGAPASAPRKEQLAEVSAIHAVLLFTRHTLLLSQGMPSAFEANHTRSSLGTSTMLPAAILCCFLNQQSYISVSCLSQSCSSTAFSQAKVRRPSQLSCQLLPEQAYQPACMQS